MNILISNSKSTSASRGDSLFVKCAVFAALSAVVVMTAYASLITAAAGGN